MVCTHRFAENPLGAGGAIYGPHMCGASPGREGSPAPPCCALRRSAYAPAPAGGGRGAPFRGGPGHYCWSARLCATGLGGVRPGAPAFGRLLLGVCLPDSGTLMRRPLTACVGFQIRRPGSVLRPAKPEGTSAARKGPLLDPVKSLTRVTSAASRISIPDVPFAPGRAPDGPPGLGSLDMARMLGAFSRPCCPQCRTGWGPDCADKSRSKRAQRALEKRQWRREALWPS